MSERKLTLKQQKWLNVYIETGNATEAARQVYACKTDGSARAVGYENLTKLHVQVTEILDRMGLSDAHLVKVLDEGLKANKVELAKFQGRIGAERAYPDFATRRAYLEIALKLKGHLRDRISLEDPEGKPLGPVFLPVDPTDRSGNGAPEE